MSHSRSFLEDWRREGNMCRNLIKFRLVRKGYVVASTKKLDSGQGWVKVAFSGLVYEI